MARKKAVQTPGEDPKPKVEVKTPGVPEPAPVPDKRAERAAPRPNRGSVCNDYATAMAKVKSGELQVPVLTNQGWIVEKPAA